MLCELRLKPGCDGGDIGFQSIKILAPATIYRTDVHTKEVEEAGPHFGEGVTEVHMHNAWHLCEADNSLHFIAEDDLQSAIHDGDYELVQKSAVPHKLKTLLDKITAIQNSSDENENSSHPEADNIADLRDEVWPQVPEKWAELFRRLVDANMFSIEMRRSDKESIIYAFDIDELLGTYNGNAFSLGITTDWTMGMGHNPNNGETAHGELQKSLQELAGDSYKVTVEPADKFEEVLIKEHKRLRTKS